LFAGVHFVYSRFAAHFKGKKSYDCQDTSVNEVILRTKEGHSSNVPTKSAICCVVAAALWIAVVRLATCPRSPMKNILINQSEYMSMAAQLTMSVSFFDFASYFQSTIITNLSCI
jgi:hypothetical protein